MKPITIADRPRSTSLLVPKVFRSSETTLCKTDTVIDESTLIAGIDIQFPEDLNIVDIFSRPIKFLTVPPLSFSGRLEGSGDLSFINPISFLLNTIVIELSLEYRNQTKIQKLVNQYYTILINRIVGKNGIIAKSVIGTRIPHSGRLVLSPSIERDPQWVGISANALRAADVKEGEYVIVFRDPVIWNGSIEILQAYPIENNVISLHPLAYAQFGADNDGDQMGFIKPDMSNPLVKKEIETNFCKFLKENAKWPKYLCKNGEYPESPVWDNITEDTIRRFTVSGASYGPRDITSKPTKRILEIENLLNKKLYDRNKAITTDTDDNWSTIVETNHANVFMKRFLGIVGATARRVILLFSEYPSINTTINKISEIIQQDTLDAKHKVGDQNSIPTPTEIMEFFERTKNWKGIPVFEDRYIFIKRLGLQHQEIIEFLYIIDYLCAIKFGLLVRGVQKAKIDEKISQNILKLSLEKKEECLKLLNFPYVKEKYQFDPNDYHIGLSVIVEYFYPVYFATTKSATRSAEGVFSSLFHDNCVDLGSVGSISLPRIS